MHSLKKMKRKTIPGTAKIFKSEEDVRNLRKDLEEATAETFKRFAQLKHSAYEWARTQRLD